MQASEPRLSVNKGPVGALNVYNSHTFCSSVFWFIFPLTPPDHVRFTSCQDDIMLSYN
jgi:hypothetical protein